MLQIFLEILKRPNEQLCWQITMKRQRQFLDLGLKNDDPETNKYANECLDLILKMGVFEFLELNEGVANVG